MESQLNILEQAITNYNNCSGHIVSIHNELIGALYVFRKYSEDATLHTTTELLDLKDKYFEITSKIDHTKAKQILNTHIRRTSKSTCVCGITIQRSSIYNHVRTKAHKLYISTH